MLYSTADLTIPNYNTIVIRENEACGIMSHGRDNHKGSAAVAEATAAREAAAVAAGLLA